MTKKKSVTLLFPGQGSQYVGMGKNWESPLFEEADLMLGFSLSEMMRDGPAEELTLTANAQPAILTHSLALYGRLKPLLKKNDIAIERVLGHSVGEYAALVVAGALDFKDALQSVRWRGAFMQEATPAGSGTMVAILKVPEETVRQACEESSTTESKVMPANYNTPSQIVISGHTQACHQAIQWIRENHPAPFRSVELNVSAPFHSSLMAPAAEKLREKFCELTFRPTLHPYIANWDAKEYPEDTPGSVVEENLLKQVASPVLWLQSVEQIPSSTFCLECGCGRTLAGLIKKIDPTLRVVSLDQSDGWEECNKEIFS